jgi:hypothetical protein
MMTKQIEIHGQRVRLFSSAEGRTWSSSPRPIDAYSQRKLMSRLELQKSFARIDKRQDPDLSEVENSMNFIIGR